MPAPLYHPALAHPYLSLIAAAARQRHLAHVHEQLLGGRDPAVPAEVGGDAEARLALGDVRRQRGRSREPLQAGGGN